MGIMTFKNIYQKKNYLINLIKKNRLTIIRLEQESREIAKEVNFINKQVEENKNGINKKK